MPALETVAWACHLSMQAIQCGPATIGRFINRPVPGSGPDFVDYFLLERRARERSNMIQDIRQRVACRHRRGAQREPRAEECRGSCDAAVIAPDNLGIRYAQCIKQQLAV